MQPADTTASEYVPAAERIRQTIKALMGMHDVSQATIGDVIDLSQRAVSQRLGGDVEFRVTEAERIASFFGLAFDDLLHPELSMSPEKFKLLQGMVKDTSQRQLPGIGGPDLRVLKNDD